MQKAAAAIPSFHDGLLTSVLLGDHTATLGLKRSDGDAYELDLIGLESLQVENLRQGNIVSELEVITGRLPQYADLDDRLERLFPSPSASAAAKYHEAYLSFLAAALARVESGEAAIVIVESSYGCDLVGYCTTVALREP